jgi:hypothetical protein
VRLAAPCAKYAGSCGRPTTHNTTAKATISIQVARARISQ